MSLFKGDERPFIEAVSLLVTCNPFLPERVKAEQAALGESYVGEGIVWSLREGIDRDSPNIKPLLGKAVDLRDKLRSRLVEGGRADPQERLLYEDLALFLIYHHYREPFQELIRRAEGGHGQRRATFYRDFQEESERYLALPGVSLPGGHSAPHIFAIFFHLKRAFHQIYSHIVGTSMAAARLRAEIWQSIFTHDLRRYRRALYDRMGDLATLITGPSGTGKELVARAIGLARYIPFDPQKECFTEDFAGSFYPLNLSALSSTLIESELFGHSRGSFTGATSDHSGWLEICGRYGTVFLDEIGELDSGIQVKLLRVLETREFQRLGDTRTLRFRGKVIAATNRDLGREMCEERFRQDLYYRLCSDIIETPSLADQLRESPGELRNLLLFITRRIVGEEAEALAEEVSEVIERNLGPDYPWPGNFRELEQCVRNVLVRRDYRGAACPAPDARAELADAVTRGTLSADELLGRYCTLLFGQTGSYSEAARRLGLDRRTVKSKVDPELLERLRDGG